MSNQEIIEQGWLEAYITDDLSSEEASMVEASLMDLDVREEYLNIQKQLERMALESGISPDQRLKIELLNTLVKKSTKRPFTYLIAASISLALLSTIAAFFFYSRYQAVDGELAELQSQNSELNNDIQTVSQEMDRMKNDLTVLINPAFTRVVMNSTQDGLVQQAVIYYNPSEQQVYLNTSTLPELTEDQQYQLWALIDGQPVDAGTFNILKDQFQLMKEFERVDAFAVTIEPKGGSENPTLEAMQVYGEV